MYTDLPQPLDDIEIKQDGEGFKIRLNQTDYLRYVDNNDASEKGVEPGRNNNYFCKDQKLCSNTKQPVLLLQRCDDDLKIVNLRKGKRNKRHNNKDGVSAMSSDPPKRRDNIFDIMWLAEDAVERSKRRKTSISLVPVKEEANDLGQESQYGNTNELSNDSFVSFREETQIENVSASFIPGISDLDREETLSYQSLPLSDNMDDIYVENSSILFETSYIINDNVPSPDVIISDDDTPAETEEPAVPKEGETCDRDSNNFTLTKFDLIKLRRERQMKSSSEEMSSVQNRGRTNIRDKGKQTQKSVLKRFSDCNTDEEADDEESDDSNNDNDSDETEIYDPKQGNGNSPSSDESDGGGIIACPKCDIRFRDVSKLKTHMLTHFTEKSYQCKVCMRAFGSTAGLKRHIAVHEKSNAWKCRKCKKEFPSQKELELHTTRIHPGFRRFKCNLCKDRFSTKAQYESHMMVHINSNVQQSSVEDVIDHEVSEQTALPEAIRKPSTTKPRNRRKVKTKKTNNKNAEREANPKIMAMTTRNKTSKSKFAKLPCTHLNITPSTENNNITTTKSPQISRNNPGVKPLKVPSVKIKTNKPTKSKANTVNKLSTEKVNLSVKNASTPVKGRAIVSMQEVSESVLNTPPPVHKPSVTDIGRKVNTSPAIYDSPKKQNQPNSNNNVGNGVQSKFQNCSKLPGSKGPVSKSKCDKNQNKRKSDIIFARHSETTILRDSTLHIYSKQSGDVPTSGSNGNGMTKSKKFTGKDDAIKFGIDTTPVDARSPFVKRKNSPPTNINSVAKAGQNITMKSNNVSSQNLSAKTPSQEGKNTTETTTVSKSSNSRVKNNPVILKERTTVKATMPPGKHDSKITAHSAPSSNSVFSSTTSQSTFLSPKSICNDHGQLSAKRSSDVTEKRDLKSDKLITNEPKSDGIGQLSPKVSSKVTEKPEVKSNKSTTDHLFSVEEESKNPTVSEQFLHHPDEITSTKSKSSEGKTDAGNKQTNNSKSIPDPSAKSPAPVEVNNISKSHTETKQLQESKSPIVSEHLDEITSTKSKSSQEKTDAGNKQTYNSKSTPDPSAKSPAPVQVNNISKSHTETKQLKPIDTDDRRNKSHHPKPETPIHVCTGTTAATTTTKQSTSAEESSISKMETESSKKQVTANYTGNRSSNPKKPMTTRSLESSSDSGKEICHYSPPAECHPIHKGTEAETTKEGKSKLVSLQKSKDGSMGTELVAVGIVGTKASQIQSVQSKTTETKPLVKSPVGTREVNNLISVTLKPVVMPPCIDKRTGNENTKPKMDDQDTKSKGNSTSKCESNRKTLTGNTVNTNQVETLHPKTMTTSTPAKPAAHGTEANGRVPFVLKPSIQLRPNEAETINKKPLESSINTRETNRQGTVNDTVDRSSNLVNHMTMSSVIGTSDLKSEDRPTITAKSSTSQIEQPNAKVTIAVVDNKGSQVKVKPPENDQHIVSSSDKKIMSSNVANKKEDQHTAGQRTDDTMATNQVQPSSLSVSTNSDQYDSVKTHSITNQSDKDKSKIEHIATDSINKENNNKNISQGKIINKKESETGCQGITTVKSNVTDVINNNCATTETLKTNVDSRASAIATQKTDGGGPKSKLTVVEEKNIEDHRIPVLVNGTSDETTKNDGCKEAPKRDGKLINTNNITKTDDLKNKGAHTDPEMPVLLRTSMGHVPVKGEHSLKTDKARGSEEKTDMIQDSSAVSKKKRNADNVDKSTLNITSETTYVTKKKTDEQIGTTSKETLPQKSSTVLDKELKSKEDKTKKDKTEKAVLYTKDNTMVTTDARKTDEGIHPPAKTNGDQKITNAQIEKKSDSQTKVSNIVKNEENNSKKQQAAERTSIYPDQTPCHLIHSPDLVDQPILGQKSSEKSGQKNEYKVTKQLSSNRNLGQAISKQTMKDTSENGKSLLPTHKKDADTGNTAGGDKYLTRRELSSCDTDPEMPVLLRTSMGHVPVKGEHSLKTDKARGLEEKTDMIQDSSAVSKKKRNADNVDKGTLNITRETTYVTKKKTDEQIGTTSKETLPQKSSTVLDKELKSKEDKTKKDKTEKAVLYTKDNTTVTTDTRKTDEGIHPPAKTNGDQKITNAQIEKKSDSQTKVSNIVKNEENNSKKQQAAERTSIYPDQTPCHLIHSPDLVDQPILGQKSSEKSGQKNEYKVTKQLSSNRNLGQAISKQTMKDTSENGKSLLPTHKEDADTGNTAGGDKYLTRRELSSCDTDPEMPVLLRTSMGHVPVKGEHSLKTDKARGLEEKTDMIQDSSAVSKKKRNADNVDKGTLNITSETTYVTKKKTDEQIGTTSKETLPQKSSTVLDKELKSKEDKTKKDKTEKAVLYTKDNTTVTTDARKTDEGICPPAKTNGDQKITNAQIEKKSDSQTKVSNIVKNEENNSKKQQAAGRTSIYPDQTPCHLIHSPDLVDQPILGQKSSEKSGQKNEYKVTKQLSSNRNLGQAISKQTMKDTSENDKSLLPTHKEDADTGNTASGDKYLTRRELSSCDTTHDSKPKGPSPTATTKLKSTDLGMHTTIDTDVEKSNKANTTTEQPNNDRDSNSTLLEKSQQEMSKDDNKLTDRVSSLLQNLDTKQSKLADVIKELISNAPKEEKVEIGKILKEHSLNEETEKPKKEDESTKSSKSTFSVESFESRTYNKRKLTHQSTRKSPPRGRHKRSRRSRSRSRDRHSRRSKSRERHLGNSRDKKHSPTRGRHRSRSPTHRFRHSGSPVRRERRSRTPEYRRHFHNRNISPYRRYPNPGYRRMRSRSPIHGHRYSRSSPKRTGFLHARRMSVSPRRNSRSKDLQRYTGESRSSRDKDRESRSSRSTDKSICSNHSSDRHSRRSTQSRERERGWSKERYLGRSPKSEKSVSPDHGKEQPSRRSTSSNERHKIKEHYLKSTSLTDTIDNEVSRSTPSADMVTNKNAGSIDGGDKSSLTQNTTSNGENKGLSIKEKYYSAINSEHNPESLQKCTDDKTLPGRIAENDARDAIVNSKGLLLYGNKSDKISFSVPALSTGKTDVPKIPQEKDNSSLLKVYGGSVNSRDATYSNPSNSNTVQVLSKTQTRTGSSNPGTNDSNVLKLPHIQEEQWKKAWYQKVDNKKLILDTMENDSYGKSHQQHEKVVLVSNNKEEWKSNTFLHHSAVSSQKSTDSIDDVFLPATTASFRGIHDNKGIPPSSRRDENLLDSSKQYHLGRTQTTIENERQLQENCAEITEKGRDDKSEYTSKDISELSSPDATWKVRPLTTVMESTSLFKSAPNVSKFKYPDFKVTIQNTAQFISVTESPASPEPETSNLDKRYRFLLSPQSPENVSSRRSPKGGTKATHMFKQLETSVQHQKPGDISGEDNGHKPTQNATAVQSSTENSISDETDACRKASTSTGINNYPRTRKTSGGIELDKFKYKNNQSNQINKSPNQKRRHETKPKNPHKPTQDSIIDFNRTLQELHSTLQQITKSAISKNLTDDVNGKHHQKSTLKSPSQEDNTKHITKVHKTVKRTSDGTFKPLSQQEKTTNVTEVHTKVKTTSNGVFKLSDPRKVRPLVQTQIQTPDEQKCSETVTKNKLSADIMKEVAELAGKSTALGTSNSVIVAKERQNKTPHVEKLESILKSPSKNIAGSSSTFQAECTDRLKYEQGKEENKNTPVVNTFTANDVATEHKILSQESVVKIGVDSSGKPKEISVNPQSTTNNDNPPVSAESTSKNYLERNDNSNIHEYEDMNRAQPTLEKSERKSVEGAETPTNAGQRSEHMKRKYVSESTGSTTDNDVKADKKQPDKKAQKKIHDDEDKIEVTKERERNMTARNSFKDVKEDKTQPDKDIEKKIYDDEDVTEARENPTKERERNITAGNTFKDVKDHKKQPDKDVEKKIYDDEEDVTEAKENLTKERERNITARNSFKDVKEDKKQPDKGKNVEKKIYEDEEETEAREDPTKERERNITVGNSFEDVKQDEKQSDKDVEKKIYDDEEDVTKAKKNPTKNRERRITAGNSFYLASQEPKSEKTYYDEDSGTWRSYSADSKRYWTKHPPTESNHINRDERQRYPQQTKNRSREPSPIREQNSHQIRNHSRESSPSREENSHQPRNHSRELTPVRERNSHQTRNHSRESTPITERNSHQTRNSNKYKCHNCKVSFSSYFELDVHKVLIHGHGDKKVYTCHICHEKFRYHADLDEHKLTGHKQNLHFKCSECSDSFHTEGKLCISLILSLYYSFHLLFHFKCRGEHHLKIW